MEASAQRLENVLTAFNALMKVMARACGHSDLRRFTPNDITSWKREVAELTGIRYAGIGGAEPGS